MISINISISIDRQTQDFLKQIVQIYTPADLQATKDLGARIDRSKARLDLIDQHLQQTGKTS